jgi:hypothetical protein
MDANGVLASCYDSTNTAIRTISSPDRIAYQLGDLHLVGATVLLNNNYPRVAFADAATQTVHGVLWPLYQWGSGALNITWVNDSAASGNVRWSATVYKTNYGSSIASPTTFTNTQNITASGQNILGASQLLAGIDTSLTGFGGVLAFKVERIGADAGDTLAGSVSIADIVFLPE